MKYVIIGGGPAGISAAYYLCKAGHEVNIYEASDAIGGMAKSISLWGQIVDLGPHRFFTKEKHVNNFFKEVLEGEYVSVNRQTSILYKGKYFDYPLKLSNVFRNLSIPDIIKVLTSYLAQKVNPIRNPNNFEEWVINRFGKKLFSIFFKNYSEKLWGLKCTEIDASFAEQRIKSLSLWQAVLNTLIIDKNQKHKTLISEFLYPKYGSGHLYDKAASAIQAMGGKIHFNKPVQKVILNNGIADGVQLLNGDTIKADHVISTMPLTHLIKGLEQVPSVVQQAAEKLIFRNTILVYLEVDESNLFNENWIYIHSPELKHGRITNFRNWSPFLTNDKKSTILCMEYWAFDSDTIWRDKDEKIIALAQEEFAVLNLTNEINSKIINSKVVRVPKCYPVYKKGYIEDLDVVQNYLDTIKGITPIGRYGAFKYNNQDHSILMGILAAEKLEGVNNTNLWDVNTDTAYQEEGKIKDILA